MAKLTLYWEFGQKGIKYFNDGHIITFQEATQNASRGKYEQVADEWGGPIPVNIWKDIMDRKSYLEQKIAEQ